MLFRSSGVLTSNQIIVFPSTVQLYAVTNNTTGAYTLTFKTSAVGALTTACAQGESLILICDGTNVYNATTASIGILSSLTLAVGSVAAPSLNFTGNTDTGLYVPSSNQLGIACAGVNVATFTGTSLLVPVGISGGTF